MPLVAYVHVSPYRAGLSLPCSRFEFPLLRKLANQNVAGPPRSYLHEIGEIGERRQVDERSDRQVTRWAPELVNRDVEQIEYMNFQFSFSDGQWAASVLVASTLHTKSKMTSNAPGI